MTRGGKRGRPPGQQRPHVVGTRLDDQELAELKRLMQARGEDAGAVLRAGLAELSRPRP